MTSLQARLSAGLLGSLAVLLVLQWLGAGWFVRRIAQEQMSSRLEHDAQALLAAVSRAPDGRLVLNDPAVAQVYERPFSGHYFVVASGGSTLTSRSLWDETLRFEPAAPGGRRTLHASGPDAQKLLVFVAGYRKHSLPITIAVAEDLSDFERALLRFQIGLTGISAVVLALLLWLQRALLRAGLRPLERLRAELTALDQGKVERLTTALPDEIAPVAVELNRLIANMHSRGHRSRKALGNLAHALKTHLALLAQVAEDPEVSAVPGLAARIGAPLDHMRTLTDRELKRARLAGAALPGQHIEVAQAREEVLHALRRIYAEKDLEFQVDVPPATRFAGDAEDFFELAGNLFDNAARFARRIVRVTARMDDALTLMVEDDGPGCDAALLDTLATRGARADESSAGSGLGLAIVRDIVDSYDGALMLGRSDTLGGFRVQAQLPTRR